MLCWLAREPMQDERLTMATIGVNVYEDVFSCFIYHPSRFLERSGTRSEGQLQNVTMCLERCIEASTLYGFVCRSLMWKKDINLCILSIYDRTQKADRFRTALKSDIDLYENTCVDSNVFKRIAFKTPSSNLCHLSRKREKPLEASVD
ncbi:PAN domain protein [Cooperia oncophora]